VLIVPSTHDMRIEVGYGLEGDLPDGLAGEIARTNFMPTFKTGDISGGVRDGVANTSPTLATQVLIPAGGVMALVGYGLGGRNKVRRIVRRSSPSRGWGDGGRRIRIRRRIVRLESSR